MNWPHGAKTDEERERLQAAEFEGLSVHEKLAWIHLHIGLLEAPNQENTKLNHGRKAVKDSHETLESYFGKLWETVKEEPLLKGVFKCMQAHREKYGMINKFNGHLNWLDKQEEKKKKQADCQKKKFNNRRY
jgi:hypothetical protein